MMVAGVVPVRRGCHVVPIGVSTLQGKSCTLQLFQRDLALYSPTASQRLKSSQPPASPEKLDPIFLVWG